MADAHVKRENFQQGFNESLNDNSQHQMYDNQGPKQEDQDDRDDLQSEQYGGSVTGSSEGPKYIRLRGLPWSATHQEILDFLKDVNVVNGSQGIHLITSRWDGKNTGEAYVEVKSQQDVEEARKLNKASMGHRYIEVFTTNPKEAKEAMRKTGSHGGSYVVKLRGLPYAVTEQQIEEFFNGLEIKPDREGILFVMDRRGRATGEAFVQFESQEDTEQALGRNREKIGHRYIEIFRSSLAELKRSANGNGRPGPYDLKDRGSNRGGFNDFNGGGRNNMRGDCWGGNNGGFGVGANNTLGFNNLPGFTNSGNFGNGFGPNGNGGPNNVGNFGNNNNGAGGGGNNGNFGNFGNFGNNGNFGHNSGGASNSVGLNNNAGFNNFNNNTMGGGAGVISGNNGNLSGGSGSGFAGNNRFNNGNGNFGNDFGDFNNFGNNRNFGGNNCSGGGGSVSGSVGSMNDFGGNRSLNNSGNFGNFGNFGNNNGNGNNGGAFNNNNNVGNFGPVGGGRGDCEYFTIHMRGLPYSAFENEVFKFFDPVRPANVRINFNKKGLHNGTADAYFETYEDAQLAMKRHREQMGSRYIELFFDGKTKGGAPSIGGSGGNSCSSLVGGNNGNNNNNMNNFSRRI